MADTVAVWQHHVAVQYYCSSRQLERNLSYLYEGLDMLAHVGLRFLPPGWAMTVRFNMEQPSSINRHR